MELFTAIDFHGIVRLPKGVEKQVKLYKRGDKVYIPHAGGFVEVRVIESNGEYSTSHPDIRLTEHEIPAKQLTQVLWVGRPAMRLK